MLYFLRYGLTWNIYNTYGTIGCLQFYVIRLGWYGFVYYRRNSIDRARVLPLYVSFLEFLFGNMETRNPPLNCDGLDIECYLTSFH